MGLAGPSDLPGGHRALNPAFINPPSMLSYHTEQPS
ncbi:hypothetical protein AA0119_g9533 [Alternaria tenuissima]|uniref:Uncharacterized protein n=2 Tax=Alternaria alternata complex TaxID=187734 RepID=A0A4Q4NF89_ALTAL|nr:hypothetical protein AA0115_g2010 [Alternaria tenuissima]RYN74941.1 hypothetical protein AA0117_g6708 [Alternaria alternata]RYN35969.1 hypothetical protein AA0114_g11691 [Alternaria tenuissima]RYN50472.1 hypothetical protein AA0118_g10990 [Alternaria tenuissima]RYN93395.1 hypothetical protein AA0119_g9533 [Alternaria tenuissima]